MRRLVILFCLGAAGLVVGCSPQEMTYSCQSQLGPRAGEYYQFAPTRAADGYFHCGTGHA